MPELCFLNLQQAGPPPTHTLLLLKSEFQTLVRIRTTECKNRMVRAEAARKQFVLLALSDGLCSTADLSTFASFPSMVSSAHACSCAELWRSQQPGISH